MWSFSSLWFLHPGIVKGWNRSIDYPSCVLELHWRNKQKDKWVEYQEHKKIKYNNAGGHLSSDSANALTQVESQAKIMAWLRAHKVSASYQGVNWNSHPLFPHGPLDCIPVVNHKVKSGFHVPIKFQSIHKMGHRTLYETLHISLRGATIWTH